MKRQKKLIGSPEVVLGNTSKPKNWALYQLDKNNQWNINRK